MRVLHVNTFDVAGGAARAAWRLHRGLLAVGEESRILARRKDSDETEVAAVETEKPRGAARAAAKAAAFVTGSCRSGVSNTSFSLPHPSWDLSRHPWVAGAQVVNLHWLAGMLSPDGVAALVKAGKKVVWTLHDMRAFSGGCHFSAGCEGYLGECGKCPQLARFEDEVPRAVLADARRAFDGVDLTVVAPSRWLADCARRSALFGGRRVECIPYGLDGGVFTPEGDEDRAAARREFGLPEDALVLLFGADAVRERRKGFAEMRAGLEAACGDPDFARRVEAGEMVVAGFGDRPGELDSFGLPVVKLGRIEGDARLARLYRAADLVMLPSLEDNLPNVMLESMCCGTPVLSHAVGGALDAIRDGEDGWLVPAGDAAAFAAVLRRVASEPALVAAMAARCRAEAPARWGLERQARDYLELYRDLGVTAPGGTWSDESGAAICPVSPMSAEYRALMKKVGRARPSSLGRKLRRWFAREA